MLRALGLSRQGEAAQTAAQRAYLTNVVKCRPAVLRVPQPPAADIPRGADASGNVELRTWHPADFNPAKSFAANKGFAPKTHLELVRDLGLADFERGVKMGGTRHYVLTGMGMRLHQAVLRYAFDHMVEKHGFTAMGVPVIVLGVPARYIHTHNAVIDLADLQACVDLSVALVRRLDAKTVKDLTQYL